MTASAPVRTRGGQTGRREWFRRLASHNRFGSFRRGRRPLVALGVAVAALGALLAVPSPAYAAISMDASFGCGPSNGKFQMRIYGLAGGQKITVVGYRPNGDTLMAQNGSANGNGYAFVEFENETLGSAPAAKFVLYNAGNWSQELASDWYNAGCSNLRLDGANELQPEQAGPMTLGLRFDGWLVNVPIDVSISGVEEHKTVRLNKPTEGQRITWDSQPCGPHTVTAVQKNDDPADPAPPIGLRAKAKAKATALALAPDALPAPDRVTTEYFAVYCPRMAAAPKAFADTALPAVTTITGTGFYERSRYPDGGKLALLLDGTIDLGTVVVSPRSGAFSAKVRLPNNLTCGGHRISASQLWDPDYEPESLRAQFKPPTNNDGDELKLAAETTITVQCKQAKLTVDPPVTEAGRTIVVTGSEFIPGKDVTIQWLDADNLPVGEACPIQKPDATGGFVVTCLVMPNIDLGTRRLQAVNNIVPRREGLFDVLIVPSSMQPGHDQFLERQ